MTIIVVDGNFYRPAGCRRPEVGEYYIAKTGNGRKRGPNDPAPTGDRLILRQLVFIDESAVSVAPEEF